MFHILVVEDDQALNKLICRVLNKNGYETASATDGEEALALLDQMYIDLIITDLMMPNMDGYDLTKALRDSGYQLPILVVTARDTFPDKAKGFKLGIDDYMVKPFLPLELVTRVKALFRRVDAFSGQEEESKNSYEIGDIKLYPKRRAAKLKDEDFALTPLEFDFLCHMLERQEHAASRDDLLKSLWKVDSREVDTRAVDDMVKRLRKKLKDQKSTVKIETVWGYGFRLTSGGEA